MAHYACLVYCPNSRITTPWELWGLKNGQILHILELFRHPVIFKVNFMIEMMTPIQDITFLVKILPKTLLFQMLKILKSCMMHFPGNFKIF